MSGIYSYKRAIKNRLICGDNPRVFAKNWTSRENSRIKVPYHESFCNFILKADIVGALQRTFDRTRGTAFAGVVAAGAMLASWGNPVHAGEAQAATPPIDQNGIEACMSHIEDNDFETRLFAKSSPCSDLTIRDVASLDTRERYLYTFDEAARRVYGIAYPNDEKALTCLRNQFTVFPVVDGKKQVPRGLGGLIKIIHSANNNGGSDDPAAGRIQNGVDWVAQKVCGLNSDQLASAPPQPEES